MENKLEETAQEEIGRLWCEARPTARTFVEEVLKLNDVPADKKQSLVRDAVAIGDALYFTTVFDYGREADGLRLSRLLKYPSKTIQEVTRLVRELGVGNKREVGLGESTTVNAYLSEFNSLLEACHKPEAIVA